LTQFEAVPCPACPGAAERRQARLAQVCGLSDEMRGWRLDAAIHRDGSTAAIIASRKLLEAGQGWLTLWGEWGTLKTYLLAAMVNEVRESGRVAVYTTMADLLDEFKRCFNPNAGTQFSVLWDRVVQADLLAIDEIEKFNPTSWAEAEFFRLVDNRYRNANETMTVWATNSRVAPNRTVIPNTRYPGYLESRINDARFAVVEMAGGDVRAAL